MSDTPLADALFDKENAGYGSQYVTLDRDELRTLERNARAAAEAKIAQVREWYENVHQIDGADSDRLSAILDEQ